MREKNQKYCMFAFRNCRQWRDLAFCLSMLTYNERSIRKLQENFACFADKLGEQDVFNSFMTIMDSAKKFAKPEARVSHVVLYMCDMAGMFWAPFEMDTFFLFTIQNTVNLEYTPNLQF